MRLLVVDNTIDRDCWGSRNLVRAAQGAAPDVFIEVRRAPERDLPNDPASYDRIVVSGSKTKASDVAPWISELDAFLKRALDCNIPVLGVCYGHQALARILGGQGFLRRSKVPELGWTQIKIVEKALLFDGLPPEFFSSSQHYDEVIEAPPGTRKLAESAVCSVQAFEIIGKRSYGIQFHPEKDLLEAEKYEREVHARGDGKLFSGAKQAKKLYNSEVSLKIFTNFLRS